MSNELSNRLFIVSLVLINLFLWTIYCEWGQKYGIPPFVKYLLSFISVTFIIIYRLSHPSKPDSGGLFKPMFFIFVGWSSILLVMVTINPHSELWPGLSYLQRILGQQFFVIPYVVPLLLLYTKFDLKFFSQLFYFSLLLLIPAILIQLYVILISGISVGDWEQQRRTMIFDIGGIFLLLTAHISRRRYVFNIAILYFILMIYLYVQWGRRAMLLDAILLLCAMLVLRLRSVYLNLNDRMKIYFAGFAVILIILAFGNIAQSTYVFQRGFTKDALDQSRGFVYEAFFLDMDTANEWIFGRGLGGSIAREADTDRVVDFVESGFLVLIYKGGLLYMIPFLVILLRASYLGLWRSKNDLIKALSIQLPIYIFSMYAWNWPEFSTKYVFMWISVTACLDPQMRNLSNEEIFISINAYLNGRNVNYTQN